MRRLSGKTIEISGNKRIVASIILASYICVISPFSIHAETPQTFTKSKITEAPIEEKAEVLISAEKGGNVTLGNASIEIPEGALKEDTKISITHLHRVQDTGESLYNATPASGGYRFLPAGTKFLKDVIITLPYNPELNSKPQALEELYTYFFDEQKKSWIKLERIEIDKAHNQVHSLSKHFTDMINATLTLPESASPVNINLNSIKNLEAANPDSHLIKFNPPKASNMGDASFSFELAIPSGRRGIQPELTISYSSGGGNGIMGKGFDINYASSITTDTRFGLPEYNTYDTYLLDGIILEEDKTENPRTTSVITYHPKKEISFNLIKRYTADNHWEVTDKSGTKRIYAQTPESCTGSGRKTFTWNLTKTIDVYGNTIVYEYTKDSGYVYPSSIRYTGYENTDGNYSVSFHYDENDIHRQDVRIDARSKEIISCKKLLTSITTHYKNGEAIRKYSFSYKDGLAMEKMLTELTVSNNADESYSYTFDYNTPVTENGETKYFAEAAEWTDGKNNPLQVGNSTSIGANFTGAAGVGYGTRFIDFRITGGASGSVSSGESYSEDSVIDINGDGRPDAISQDGYTVYVSLNNGNGFDPKQPVKLLSGSINHDLDYEQNNSSSVGWNIYGGSGIKSEKIAVSAGLGYSEVYQKTSSSVLCSFMDMDRDGLVDIVESGKDYYLKNTGNLEFTKAYISSGIPIQDVTQNISRTERNEYQKAYYIQNPFRMWKAPYDGVISIKEKARSINDGVHSSITAKTFIDNSLSDTELEIKQISNEEQISSKNGFNINKDSNLYFITDFGSEPLNTDINWNINIEYSKIKWLDKGFSFPVLMADVIHENIHETTTEPDTLIEKFRNSLPSPIFMKLYNINQKSNFRDCIVNIEYNAAWETTADNSEELYECVIQNGFFLPGTFTQKEFEDYINELKAHESDNTDSPVEYYKQFASHFTKNISADLIRLKPFTSTEERIDFYKKYPMSNELKHKCLKKYNIQGLDTHISHKGFSYTNKRSVQVAPSVKRSENTIGTVFKKNGKVFYNIGVLNDNQNYPVLYNVTDNKIECSNQTFAEVKILNRSYDSENNPTSLSFAYNKDCDGTAESTITFNLGPISYRVLNLTSEEFRKIADTFDIANTNVYAPHWNWAKGTQVKESKIDNLFDGMNMSEEEKSKLISALYGEKKAKMKTVTSENLQQSQEIIDYYYYSIKTNPDYEAAQKILDSYKIRIISKSEFPFYEKQDTDSYILQPYWRTQKTKEDIFALYHSKAETKMLQEHSELDLSKSDDKEQFDSLVNSYLENIYKQYSDLDNLLTGKCRNLNLARISEISCSIEYNQNHLYTVNNEDEKSYCTMLKLDPDSKENIEFVKRNFYLDKTVWNSNTDFCLTDNTANYSIYSYTVNETLNDVDITGEEDICINNDEFLYGGKNNWYYGIWKSTWTESDNGITEDYPFSEQMLQSFTKNTGNIKTAEEFNHNKPDTKNLNLNNPQYNDSKTDVHFYLPSSQTEYPVNIDNKLIGTVAVITELKKTPEGKVPESKYYMPYIQNDIIHAERAGGNSFYKIEGLYKTNTSQNSFVSSTDNMIIPSIRKTYTEGTDKTPNVSVSIELTESMEGLVDNKITEIMRVAQSGFTGSGSMGTNISDSFVRQAFQDINGDNLPDILQVSGDNVSAVLSSGITDGKIIYGTQTELTGLSLLGKSKCVTNVFGGSVSPGGNISVTPVGFKSMRFHSDIKPSPTPSAGLTVSNGTNSQTENLSDINGDGLCDYYNNGIYKLNTGDEFITDTENFSGNTDISKGSNKNFGINSSLSLGTSSGKNLSEASSLGSGASVNLGVSYSFSSSNTEKMMLDINGDGLQDILEMTPGSTSINVQYNTGNSFIEGAPVKLQSWANLITDNQAYFLSNLDSSGYDLGFISDIPIVGKAVSKSLAVVSINPFGFLAETHADSLDWNSSTTLGFSTGIGANINIGIDIWGGPIYCGTINITVSGGAGLNASTSINGVCVRMMDLDGDGLADHVLRIPGLGIYWKRNISGQYGQLTKITLPQGGNIKIDYKEKYGTVDNPIFKYIMSQVSINDGADGYGILPEIEHGEHTVATRFEYEDGWYDRTEKEFYGFSTVKTIYADNTCKLDKYYSRNYYLKGVLEESCFYTSDNTILSKTKTTYKDSPYSLPELEESWNWEKSSGNNNYIYTSSTYEYDEYGNCTKIIQDSGNSVKLTGVIIYKNYLNSYIIGLPERICVYASDGTTLLRKREGIYNTLGQLTELHQFYSDTSYSINTLTYDDYGNIVNISDSRGATLTYTYDSSENMFIKEISQYGFNTDTYISSLDYDTCTQTKTKETDCNGNTLNYEYDSWQRINKIWTSYDTQDNPAVSYEYQTPNNNTNGQHDLWYTITNNKVTFDKNDTRVIKTILQIDGLGRSVCTAKTGFVNGIDGWNTSSAAEYDSKGRIIKEGMTKFIRGTLEELLATKPEMTSLYTSYEYDEKDRLIKTVLPDNAVQSVRFKIYNGCLISSETDPLGNISIQETDSRGNITRVAKKDSEGTPLTQVTYRYNEIGEMLRAFDAKGNPIIAEYDLLGRRTVLESLDSGRQEFFYDASSNLIRENNSVLKEHNKQIVYEYDGLNRLVKIDYPDTEDTFYTYGSASDTHGAAGKILNVTDASGSLSYEYGELGEVKKETRTVSTHININNPTVTATMEYRSDYLGRMQWIIYPDGEKITYGYDNGGQVISVTGRHYNHDFNYVTNILYDEYGQRTRIDYGNNTFTEYKYDLERRWLSSIKTQKTDLSGNPVQTYQNIVYSFDTVGNVLAYENNCLDSMTGNYKTKQTYSYDNLYQLISVHGETTFNPHYSSVPEFRSEYSQTFTFDSDGLGNMTSKISSETVSPQRTIGDNLNYKLAYIYDSSYAHRLVHAGERYYRYDSNGNIICEQDGSFESNGENASYHRITQEAQDVYSTDYGWGLFREESTGTAAGSANYRRTYTWNERNQLISSVDATCSTSYIYGQDGQRSNKYTQNSETLYFNNMWTLHTDSGNSVYGGQTAKNIYLGETRIATKLNSGNNPAYQEEYYKQYYYHSDHLGSASLISDYKGDEYQRIEYTPYGETWVEKTDPQSNLNFLPYRFTAKELDEETGLYYYGARYLDPKYSMWISTDPALGEYIPKAPVNEEAKKYNQNLPGMGGVFNHINNNLYHYAGNNPVHYIDPDGRKIDTSEISNNKECLRRFNIAISELKKTERGAFIIKQLEESKIVYTITHNNNNKNKYNPENKTIEWDSNRILVKEFHFDSKEKKWIYDEYIDAITLLGHELGHAYQDFTGELPESVTHQQQELLDDKNIEENERPIAKERGCYERKDHREFLHPLKFTAKEFLE